MSSKRNNKKNNSVKQGTTKGAATLSNKRSNNIGQGATRKITSSKEHQEDQQCQTRSIKRHNNIKQGTTRTITAMSSKKQFQATIMSTKTIEQKALSNQCQARSNKSSGNKNKGR
jgi:hypothetical protein